MLKPAMAIALLLLVGSNIHAFGGSCLLGRDAALPPSVVSDLRISEDQKAVIESLHEAFEREFRPLQNQLLGKRGELAHLWEESDPDEAKIASKQTEIRELQSRIEELSTQYRLKCRQILSPEQRRNLTTFSNRHSGPKGGRHWINSNW